jgi:uncharacterized protein involved in exopolysaccharide biosynthesis
MQDKNIINSNNSRSSLADIILLISKHFKFILIITILAVFITFIHVRNNFKPKYTSSSVLFIPSENYSGSAFSRIANQFGVNTGGGTNVDISSSALYPQIVTSRTFAAKLLQKEFYTEKYGRILPLMAIFSYGTGTSNVGIDTLIIRLSGRIPSMINFSTSEKPFLTLNVTTDEPQFSKDLANAVLEELDKLQREFKSKTVNEKKNYIEQQIVIAQSELEKLEENLKNFREANRRIDTSPSLMLKRDRMERNVQIQQGIFLTLKQQLELAKIEEVQKSSFVQILDYPSLPLTISNPPRQSSYILGGFAGLFLSLCIVFVIEYFSSGNPEETEKLKTAKRFLTKDIQRVFKIKKK